MNEKEYIGFYEGQDRINIYSGCADPEKHSFINILKSLKKYLSAESPKVLEIGAGNGRFQDVFKNYTGIDITESSRKFFHKKYIVIKDGDSYPFQDNYFDLVFNNAIEISIKRGA